MLREKSICGSPVQQAHSFEVSCYWEIVIICHLFWQVEPKIVSSGDIENEQTRKSLSRAAGRKLLLFHLKTSKSHRELQQILQGEVLSQADKWVTQSIPPHPPPPPPEAPCIEHRL